MRVLANKNRKKRKDRIIGRTFHGEAGTRELGREDERERRECNEEEEKGQGE